MASGKEKMQELEARKRILEARIQSIRTRTSKQERALDTRRKILAGAYFIKLLGGDLRRVGMRLKEASFLEARDEGLFGIQQGESSPLVETGEAKDKS